MNLTSLCPLAALVPLALLLGCTTEPSKGGEDDAADTGTDADTDPGVDTGDDDDDDDDATGDDDDDDDTTGDDDDDDDDDDSDGPQGECGNGAIEGDEVCDDGIDNGQYEHCATDCSGIGRYCGDGVMDEDGGEGCDYGDDNGSSECNGVCQIRGTVLATITETIDFTESGTNPYANGIRVARWNDRLTAVYGGFAVTVWEIDEENLNTEDLRVAFEYGPVGIVNGVVPLDSGNVLITGGNQFNPREAVILDASLEIQWEYPAGPGIEHLVGAAPHPSGAFIGANHLTEGGEPAYWVAEMETDGSFGWEAVETTASAPVVRDLRGLAGDRAVMLSRTNAGTPRIRIYDADGELVANDLHSELTGEYDRLCPGGSAFGLSNTDAGTLQAGDPNDIVVFDAEGDSIHTVEVPLVEGEFVDEFGCAVRDDGSPIAAINIRANDFAVNRFDILGFDGTEVDWSIETPHNLGISTTSPAVHLEEHHAWVFFGGEANDTTRFMRAFKVAI